MHHVAIARDHVGILEPAARSGDAGRAVAERRDVDEDLFGSNPHSNGLFFSRSPNVFFDSRLAINIIINLIVKIIIEMYNMNIIIYTNY